jgi:hypothetical protein
VEVLELLELDQGDDEVWRAVLRDAQPRQRDTYIRARRIARTLRE